MAFDRSDPLVQRSEVEPFDERPHEARPVIGRQEALEVGWAENKVTPTRCHGAYGCPSQSCRIILTPVAVTRTCRISAGR